MSEIKFTLPKTERISKLISHLFEKMPEVEADRAELIYRLSRDGRRLFVISWKIFRSLSVRAN